MTRIDYRKWFRTILSIVLAYEGAGALLGGSLLILAPNGSLMNMPVEIMHNSFSDFLIPGIILFGLGILNMAGFFAVLKKSRFNRIIAEIALVGLLIWFSVEIAILQMIHWLHIMWGLPVIIGSIAALLMDPIPIMIVDKK